MSVLPELLIFWSFACPTQLLRPLRSHGSASPGSVWCAGAERVLDPSALLLRQHILPSAPFVLVLEAPAGTAVGSRVRRISEDIQFEFWMRV